MAEPIQQTLAAVQHQQCSGTTREMKILVVDDEPGIRHLVRHILKRAGVSTILEAGDGSSALEQAATHHPDLIISDVRMSPRGGLDLLQRVREGAAGINPNTRVVLLTAYSDRSLVDLATSLGADGFVEKPFSSQYLIESLSEFMDAV
jgi:two-component system, response regulator PdtaR